MGCCGAIRAANDTLLPLGGRTDVPELVPKVLGGWTVALPPVTLNVARP